MAMALKGMSVSGVGERHFVINLLKRRREVSAEGGSERAMRRMTPLQTAGDRSHYSKPKLKMTRTFGLHPVSVQHMYVTFLYC